MALFVERYAGQGFPQWQADSGDAGPALTCPGTAPKRHFDVKAIYATAMPGGVLTYNARGGLSDPPNTKITDAQALMYQMTAETLNGAPVNGNLTILGEPLVLRAAAGDCITVTLTNALPIKPPLNGGRAPAKRLLD